MTTESSGDHRRVPLPRPRRRRRRPRRRGGGPARRGRRRPRALTGAAAGARRRRRGRPPTRPDVAAGAAPTARRARRRPSRRRSAAELEQPATAARPRAPEPAQGRLVRLRARLARSNSALGQGLLALLSRDTPGRGDLGRGRGDAAAAPTSAPARPPSWSTGCARGSRSLGTRDPARGAGAAARGAARRWSTRRWTARSRSTRHDGRPAVVLVVGVNGTGKTTTVGKLARVLVARGQGRRPRRGRHLPRRGRRPAADLGRPGRGARPCAATGTAPTRRPWPSTRSRRASRPRSTSS